jgi:hypothetical protein
MASSGDEMTRFPEPAERTTHIRQRSVENGPQDQAQFQKELEEANQEHQEKHEEEKQPGENM